jgi:hypothetical protein
MSGPRYSVIPGGAPTDPRLKGKALQVLCILGRHTDRKGWCTRSQVGMSRLLGCSPSTVNAAVKLLVECGYLEQRRLVRDDGGDRASEYRVLLDDVRPAEFINISDELEDDGAESDTPPVGIQTPPVSAQSRHPGIGSGSTPNRTISSSNDLEREARAPLGSEVRRKLDAGAERAAAADVARADAAFMSNFRQWVDHEGDNIVRSHSAWTRLAEEDRQSAIRVLPIVVAKHRLSTKGRYRFFTFLEERKWLDLDPVAGSSSAGGATILLEPGANPWMAVFWRRYKAGERVKFMFEQAFPIGGQPRQGFRVALNAVPTPDEIAGLVKIAVRDPSNAVTPEFRAWADAMSEAGVFRFNEHDMRLPFVMVPSQWPPGRAGEAVGAVGISEEAGGY